MAAAVAASTLETFTREAPARVNGTSAMSIDLHVGSMPRPRTTIRPSTTVIARPPASKPRPGGGSRGRGVEPRPGPGHRSHRPDQRIIGVQHGPPVRLGDPDDDRLGLGELLDGVHAQQPQVIGADVRHHRDVVAPRFPTPRSRMPPRAVSVTATCTARVLEHPRGAARTGPVAALHLFAVDVDAVRRRPARGAAAGLDQMRDQPGRGGLAVGPGHRDDRDGRPQRPHRLAGIVAGHRGRYLAEREDRVDPVRGDPGERPGDGRTEQLSSAAVPERVGHHHGLVVSGPGDRGDPGAQRARRAPDDGGGELGGRLHAGGRMRQPDGRVADPQRALPGDHSCQVRRPAPRRRPA